MSENLSKYEKFGMTRPGKRSSDLGILTHTGSEPVGYGCLHISRMIKPGTKRRALSEYVV